MNTRDDAARFELAVRAFRAVQPSEREVEAGVRRALTHLKRSSQRRRSRLVPALVVVILALGALAYAKPSGVATLLSTLIDSNRELRSQRAAPGQPAQEERQAEIGRTNEPSRGGSPPAPATQEAPAPLAPATPEAERASSESKSRSAPIAPKLDQSDGSNKPGWAEVRGALDDGDSARALEALDALRQSGDPATRAKASFGAAQLLWARGERSKACAIARSLTSDGGGLDQRTRERAQALLANCSRNALPALK